MSSDVRAWLDEHLEPLLPTGWKWVPYQRDVGTLSAVTVTWKQSRILPLAESPIGSLRVEGTLTVATPLTDIEKSEEDLDQAVSDLCTAIDGIKGLAWTEANKVRVGPGDSAPLGWDIDVWTTATKPTITPEPAPEPDPEEGE